MIYIASALESCTLDSTIVSPFLDVALSFQGESAKLGFFAAGEFMFLCAMRRLLKMLSVAYV